MKKWTVLAALMAAFVLAGQAWAGGSCCPMGGKKKSSDCSKYLSGIELTADQQEKISKIEEECKAQGSSPEACKSSMSAIRDVLTDDQRATFDAACKKEGKKEGCGS